MKQYGSGIDDSVLRKPKSI